MALLLLLLALTAHAATARSDPYDALAGPLAQSARKEELRNISVVPFAYDADPQAGALLAERVATRLVAAGGLNILDRARLAELNDGGMRPFPTRRDLDEELDLIDRTLAQLRHVDVGAWDDVRVQGHRADLERRLEDRATEIWKQIERLRMIQQENAFRVEAMLNGVVVSLPDGRVEIHARLVAPGTALVLGSASARVERDWGTPAPEKPNPFALAGAFGGAATALWLAARSLFG